MADRGRGGGHGGGQKDTEQVYLIRRIVAIAIAVLVLFSCVMIARATIAGISSFRQALSAKPEPEPKVKRLKPKPKPKPKVVVAWQPSHQDDTGDGNWHEYAIAGSIVDFTMAAAKKVKSIKAWDISDGLSGSNSYSPEPSNLQAFDRELAIANARRATYFISIHIGNSGDSGVQGFYTPADSSSKILAERLVIAIATKTGMPSKGVSEEKLYSLDATRNKAQYRVLLEIGGSEEDIQYLQDKANQRKVATALAGVVDGLAP